ncbi:inositol hexakisphosphate and diphosphoinositol-pentakisphosphate kinase isoform X12 [Trichogramma pretiosum]|uniref:inositol hexakisphosphate and diphosphoinositol-pentakisphosphate kinase isoform X12 n=1 Tax=Trichogramma pretiosum TaxID=7493 RepID=UPI000C71C64E|nr:inositol hexakisphosphate and diphosphoinositol-pentakisphosphate kinase isoform X12 [Trichogramma pretiosum]
MSYTELEHGYQDLRSTTNQPIFYVGDIGAGQAGLVGPGGSPLYCPANRGELSEGCVNEDGFLAGGEPEGEGKQVLVGICAMAKKSQSKPMKEILTRLEEFEYIKIIVFAEEVILKEPVDKWPVVDCLISFHSKGFPLDKAIKYAELRNPFIINNLDMQYDIQDRRRVYAILEGEGIEIPRYAVLDRDSPDPKHFLPEHELVESEDHVEVNGVTFNKPFVEKPVSAEDHNIYIYYPTSAGGGSQRLFRKIGSRSSVYSPESRVRKTGSYIYEDFMPTDGTDVKVYTVGPDYAHAEARKSPALDGKVERDSEGKEIRYPVILSNAEKLISRKVCMAFKQTVCGFDLLRANGQSFVCDVNGFSFVKNSNKYYDDCAKILGNMILRELAPTLHIPWSVPFQLDDPPIVPTTFGKMMELRCVVAVIRHGDRTPKQKMKVEVRHPKFFEIFAKYDGYKHGHVKLKRPKQLQEILDTARSLLAEIQHRAAGPELEEKQGKLEQLKSVLEMYGHFSGINRKVQMKYQPRGRPRGSSSDDGSSSNRLGEPSLVLILKWGGELTPAGRIQAEELGRIFRCMYPGGQGRHLSEEDSEMLPSHGEYAGAQGLGLLRLHSTFRHDLKIYASDEGRVQMTAAAFAKGLLALEGELTPILVQMVKSANTNGLLDNDCDSSKYQNMVKNRLHEYFQQDRDFTDEDREKINPTNALSINTALDFVKNPVRCCQHVHMLIQKLMDIVRIKKDDPKTKDAILYHGETWELMGRRWGKIEKDFCTKQKRFDISKIPDIYDCIKYDLQHNNHTLQFEQAEELYIYSKYLADIVIPQEYGLTVQEKLTIGQGICTPLLKKIRADLQRNIEEPGEESVNRLNPRYSHGVSSPGRHVRTRLYFTSESHVHSLLTVLRYGGLLDVLNDEQWRRAMEYVSMVSELNYMSQIVVMLYEDPTKDPSSEERFHVELHFSPGVNCCVQKNLPPGPGFRPHSRNESSHNLQDVGSGQDSNCSTRIEEEDTEVGQLEEDVATPPQEPEVSTTIIEVDPVDAADAADSTLDSPTTSRAINMMDLDPNIMDEPYDSGFLQSSAPIPISARTVAGHEAARLGSQLAASQRQRREREAAGIICEPRARSYDHQRQDKPEKTADKLQYQSLDAVDNEASRSPKLADIFPDDCLSSKPAPLAGSLPHSVSSPDLALSPVVANVLPIINVVEEPAAPPAAPNKTTTTTTTPVAIPAPLITLHNTPLASPGTIATATAAAAAAAAAASSDVIDFSLAAANVVATNNRSNAAAAASSQKIVAVNDNGQSTSLSSSSNNARSQMLQLPGSNACYVVKKYGRSHSAMTLPVIEISDTRPSIIQPDPTTCNTARRHRHSISGQMSYFKLLGYNVSKKLTGSANSLFSTAVISGSSSAPNLKDMVPPHASAVAAIEGFGGVPPIRPLETLHNALSLRQLDVFLEMMTGAPLFRTPASSPPKSSPIGPGPNGTAAAAASSTAAGGGAGGHHQNLGIEAARYITPNPINCKGNGAAGGSSHEAELIADLKFQASPTSPNSKSEVARKQQQQRKYANETDAKIVKSPAAGTGWSSEPASFLSSEPSSPAPTSAGECSMSMSLVSNDGQKYTSNLDIDFDDFCANIEQQQQQQQQQQHQLLQQEALRESRGSVSYTDYYSNEDGQIRQRAALGGDNCFPVYVKPPSSSDGDASPTAEVDEAEEEEEEEDNNLTIKQEDAERQKKQDVQLIFEQKQSQEAAKAGSSYKKIGRFLVESRNPNEMLSSSLASADSKGTPLPTTGGGGGGGGSSSDPKKNLLRSQSVYTPKSILSSGGAKSATSLQKQSSLSMSANVQFPSDQEQQQQQQQPQPQLTLASSITDKAHVTFGFDVAQNKQN